MSLKSVFDEKILTPRLLGRYIASDNKEEFLDFLRLTRQYEKTKACPVAGFLQCEFDAKSQSVPHVKPTVNHGYLGEVAKTLALAEALGVSNSVRLEYPEAYGRMLQGSIDGVEHPLRWIGRALCHVELRILSYDFDLLDILSPKIRPHFPGDDASDGALTLPFLDDNLTAVARTSDRFVPPLKTLPERKPI